MSPPPPRAASAALSILLAGLLTLLAIAGGAPAGADEHDEPEATPLLVRLTAISPAIPARGPVVIRGVVTNKSATAWQDINVHPFVGSTPITSRDELAEAATLPETTEVGDRLTEVGQFAEIGDLAPGTSSRFVIRLPRRVLDESINGAPGAYWIGVHAIGASAEGRETAGRARTFIPLMAGTKAQASVAVVVPVRQPVRRAVDGRILDADDWADSLAEDGRLGRLLAIAEGADGAPFTWLVDPAVLDAAADVAAGNPPLDYGKARPEAEPEPSPTAMGASLRVSRSTADSAEDWLRAFTAEARPRTILGLPYADPDVAALIRLRPPMLARALTLGRVAFQSRDLRAATTFAPPSGWVSPEMAASTDAAIVLGSDRGEELERSVWSLPSGSSLVLADRRAGSGGPLPTRAMAALGVRQRILADAALHALAGETTPMTVVLPGPWEPGPDTTSAAFFQGLQRPWLSLVPLDPEPDFPPTAFPGEVPYPDTARLAELGAGHVGAAAALINAGALLAEVLDTDNEVFRALAGAALAATSYAARTDGTLPSLVRARAGFLAGELAGVRVEGTEFNTLSSGEGRLTVSVVNDLPRPVLVRLRVDSDPGLKVDAPEPVRIGPDQRTTLRLAARADNIGVHDLTLTPVTEEGTAFGTPLDMTVRTSAVGTLIWIVLSVAGGLFVVMIIRRIVKRIREHRWKAPVT